MKDSINIRNPKTLASLLPLLLKERGAVIVIVFACALFLLPFSATPSDMKTVHTNSYAPGSLSKQDKLYKLKGYVVDKSNKIVGPIKLKISNSKNYERSLTESGQFVLWVPKGTYSFEISDGNGHFHKYRNLDVLSDTSIKFMFSEYRRTIPVTASLNASSLWLDRGESTTLNWTSADSTRVVIDQGIGKVQSRGSVSVTPDSTTTYTLTAVNNFGSIDRKVTVYVDDSSTTVPTVTISSSSQSIKRGESAKILWETNGAESVSISGIGPVESSGSISVSPTSSKLYSLTAENSAGSISRDIRIKVTQAKVDPPDDDDDSSGGGGDGGDGGTDSGGDSNKGADTDPGDDNADKDVPDESGAVIDNTNRDIPDETKNVSATQTSNGGSKGTGINWPKTAILSILGIVGLGLLGFAAVSLFPAIVPWAAAALGSFGLAGAVESEGDEVHCTLYSQPEVSAGSDLLVQVFAHLLAQAEDLDELAAELDPDAKQQLSKALKQKIKQDSVLTFKLMVPGIELEEEEQEIVWRGEPDSVEFIIPIPPSHAAGKRFGRVFVYSNGKEIGKIPFRINILPLALQLDRSSKAPEVGGLMTQNECAFVSYSSRDKEKVYRFVQLMDVLKYKYHIDIFHIDAGDRWEQKLYEFIETDDVFLLFWSESASKSEWVRKEAHLAKERMSSDKKSLPRIIIYNLDGKVPVPEWLQDIHVDRKWAEIIGKIEDNITVEGHNGL